jgi:hypothetical protein
VIVADGTPAPEDHSRWYVPTARPGHRAPHLWISGHHHKGLSTLDLFGRGYVLLRLGRDPAAHDRLLKDAMDREIPVRVVDLDDDETFALYGKKLVLVRPDGHVAWRGDALPADTAVLWATVTGRAASA